MFRDELQSLVEAEMDLTAQVAVCIAAGHRSEDIKRQLGLTQAEYLMARQRIATLASRWQNERL